MDVLNVREAVTDDYGSFADIERRWGMESSEAISLDEFIDSLICFDCTSGTVGRGTLAAMCVVGDEAPRVARVLDLTVHPEWRRSQVGTRMIRHAKHCAFERGCVQMISVLSERNVRGQLFLKSNGFDCVEILPGHFDEDDGYLFSSKLGRGDVLVPVGGVVPPHHVPGSTATASEPLARGVCVH